MKQIKYDMTELDRIADLLGFKQHPLWQEHKDFQGYFPNHDGESYHERLLDFVFLISEELEPRTPFDTLPAEVKDWYQEQHINYRCD